MGMKRMKVLEEAAENLLEQYRVPGCIVAIAKHGEIVYERAFGYRDIGTKKPIDTDTVFGLASLTKSFTCAAIMTLVESGEIAVTDKVVDYLPELHVKESDKLSDITIAHFMTHASGLPPLPSLDLAMVRKRNQVLTPDHGDIPLEKDRLHHYQELLDFICAQNVGLIADPGELFSYSNDAYGLLGAIIERVTGSTYEDYVMEEVIKPCHMTQTQFLIEDYGAYDNITTCYEMAEEAGEIYVAEDWWDAPPMRATGFLKSTVRDMMRYAKLYIDQGLVDEQHVLSEGSIKEMLTPHIKMDPEKRYGYGFSVTEDYHGTTMIDHGGSLQSISSKFAILPEEGVSAIVLTNLADFPAGRLLLMALNAYFGRALDEDHLGFEEVEVPEEILASYVGEYVSEEGMDCILNLSEDGLLDFVYKGEKHPITFVAENVFTAWIDDIAEPVEILKGEDGDVFALSIYHRVVPKKKA